MQITVQRDQLLKPLGIVAGVVERRQTLPILSNLLLKSANGAVTLTGTDLEVEISADVAGEGSSGEMTVPARKLYDICRALPGDAKITISLDKDKAIIRSGKSRFRLLTMPASEFPAIETSKWNYTVTLAQRDLRWLLEKTMFCMANQDVRYYLNGLLVETKGNQLRMVATDGHRLSMAEMNVSSSISSENQIIIPRKGVQEMTSFLNDSEEQIELSFGSNHLKASAKGVNFITKLIDGRFPDYAKVVPVSQSKQVMIERDAFRETLQRAAILSNEKYRGVRFGLSKGTMTITAHNPEQEEAQEEMSVNYSGDDLEIGFNVNYISEALGAIDASQVEFGLNDPNSSCLIREPGSSKYLYVVMPMRL